MAYQETESGILFNNKEGSEGLKVLLNTIEIEENESTIYYKEDVAEGSG